MTLVVSIWPALEVLFRSSGDHVLVGLFLPYYLITVLSLLVAWTFGRLIKLKLIDFAREAVRDGHLEIMDAATFVADIHCAIRHGTVRGRRRLVA